MRLRDELARHITEADFQTQVRRLARLYKWTVVHHLRPRGTEPGWPDLTLLRPPHLLFVELKRERGRVTDAQRAMLDMLKACGATVRVWRPSAWDEIERTLRDGP